MRGAEWEPVAIFFRSVPQTPQECTRTSISPGPIFGTGTVSTRTSLTPRYTAAFIVAGIKCGGSSTAYCPAMPMKVMLDDHTSSLVSKHVGTAGPAYPAGTCRDNYPAHNAESLLRCFHAILRKTKDNCAHRTAPGELRSNRQSRGGVRPRPEPADG